MAAPEHHCSWCGMDGHSRNECADVLRREGRWSFDEFKILDSLQGEQLLSLRYGKPMREMPRAVALFAQLGRTYSTP
jgi:hypothetical protein